MKKTLAVDYNYFQNPEDLDAVETRLFDAAKEARAKAYAPYSRFLVGCALVLENGEIITGTNQENAAYPSGLCAERTTIFWTAANFPHLTIKKIFVVGGPADGGNSTAPVPPCGACRQSMLEYEVRQNQPIEIYFASLDGQVYKTTSVKDLLPFNFDVSFL